MASSKTKNGKKSQSKRFIEVAREAEWSEDEAMFDENLKRITTVKPEQKPKDKR
ncbi:MAG TPA: hypothetical protein VKQ73_02330 [Stellaceae bacterium]|nr:hypothetical protein [Stellaceae bacterium]